MPELPEVEATRRSLQAGLLGRAVTACRVRRRSVIVGPGDPAGGYARQRGELAATDPAAMPPLDPASLLVGRRINELRRHGKQLAILSEPRRDDDGPVVVVQLGMSGRLTLADTPAGSPRAPGDPPPHTHLEWDVAGEISCGDAATLRFIDHRRFGLVTLLPSAGALRDRWRGLGPDALTVRTPALARRLAGRHRPIKAALLDQAVVAGIGNIYADESLFRSGIHPERLASSLAPAEVAGLAAAMRATLRLAVRAGGSTLRDYSSGTGEAGRFQVEHRVYGRSGERCCRCRGALMSALLAQRTTVWCPICQPAG